MSTNKIVDKVSSYGVGSGSPFDTVKDIIQILPKLQLAGFTEKQIALTAMVIEECWTMEIEEGKRQIRNVIIAYAGKKAGRGKGSAILETALGSIGGMRSDTQFRHRLDEEQEEMVY